MSSESFCFLGLADVEAALLSEIQEEWFNSQDMTPTPTLVEDGTQQSRMV